MTNLHIEPLPNFGDAIDPRVIPYSHAALYAKDCEHPCPPEVAHEFEKHNRRWITFGAHPSDFIVDYEKYTAAYDTPGELERWFHLRRLLGFNCCIYTDRSNAASAVKDIGGSRHCLYWIATLDGIQLTPDALAKQLQESWNADIQAAQIWAQQVETISTPDGNYDRSVLFLDW